MHQNITAAALPQPEARELMRRLTGGMKPAEIALVIGSYMHRAPSSAELAGFREALLEQSPDPGLQDYKPLDIVGTGGDGKNSFNISTLSAMVVAACGVPVAKHGNYGVSSVSGSSNVLEHLGYRFTGDADALRRQMDRCGICFLHAPLFHPALRHVAPVRKEIGRRSLFNLLGPLVNPARPEFLVLGVSRLDHARLYHYLLQDLNKQYRLLHSFDGYDEISLTGPFKIWSPEGERVHAPGDFGFDACQQQDLDGGDSIAEAANIFMSVLRGEGTCAQRDAVVANAGLALHCAGHYISLADCFSAAAEAISSKKALHLFTSLIDIAS